MILYNAKLKLHTSEISLLKQILFLLLFTNFLFADLVDIYRTKGIEAVKLELEKELKKKSYWKSYLKNKDIQHGYYESIKYVIICDKDDKTLELHKKIKNKFETVLSKSVFIGEAKGDKQKEGDLKTPIGAYDLTTKITKLDEFYGPIALVTNYPNVFDKVQKKTGHGIWIHGLPYDSKRDDYTKGCIALENKSIKQLDKNINIHNSVLLVGETDIEKVTQDDISVILSGIFSWRDAWKSSDVNTYLAFYDKEFKRHDGMNLKNFKRYKKRIFAKNEKKKIKFSNINIMPYPNSLNKLMYKIVMHEDYKTRTYKFVGKKELYIELKDNMMSILAEG